MESAYVLWSIPFGCEPDFDLSRTRKGFSLTTILLVLRLLLRRPRTYTSSLANLRILTIVVSPLWGLRTLGDAVTWRLAIQAEIVVPPVLALLVRDVLAADLVLRCSPVAIAAAPVFGRFRRWC